ncbi:MAG TPA: hypothetical protein VFM65_04795 [Flavobacteriaceae bacterium]|nr:hypothetical protein [Flavobacteriaceae bacterium]
MALTLVISCSTHNNAWLNRNFHAMGTYYNILYNGNLALEQGKMALVQNQRDNYWKILPVERMQLVEKTDSPTDTTKNKDFARAEEKATKAIQKHSIRIDGVEYNPQTDEAFLLLGKARYYDQRFVPALAAFNYILSTVPDSSTTVPAQVWKAKTQLRMDYPELALQNLQEMLKNFSADTTLAFNDFMDQLDEQDQLEDEQLSAVAATMAQAYINLDKKENAITAISLAAEKTENNDERGRYLYIKGQLYDALEMTDSANVAFDEIIALKRRTPRVYRMHAFMEKIKNTDITEENRLAMLELLTELAENRENRPYLDNIYYQFAEYYYEIDSIDTAISYYNKSLRENSEDIYLVSRDYLTLGNINFDRAQYKEAGAYYDSTLVNLAENTREYRKLKKKRDNLDDVILYEGIAEKNDSILNLTAMTESERLAYFTEYTEKMKAEALEKELAALEAAKSAKQTAGGGFQQGTGFGNSTNQNTGKFYFYDPTQVAYGKLTFTQIWGNRALQDNWRTEEGGAGKSGSEEKEEKLTEEAIIAKIESNPKYDPQTYIAKIPTDAKVIDSLNDERNFAYYQLGVIYKEKFQEYGLATEKLEALLKNQPEDRLVLPAKYNLYKIYSITGETAKANKWKQNILTNHPSSRYAQIIRNPQEFQVGEDSPEAIYADVYRKYLAEEYEFVIQKSDEYITKFTGDDIVPKFELLKAMAIGRLQGFEAYKKALNFVALNYPLSDEGKKAQELYDTAIPAMANKEFAENTPDDSYNLVYVFSISRIDSTASAIDSAISTVDSTATGIDSTAIAIDSVKILQKKLDTAIVELGFAELSTSIDRYDSEKIFLVVHGLESSLGAAGFGEKLKTHEDYQIEKGFFEISTTNYEIILIHKNLEDYLTSKIN